MIPKGVLLLLRKAHPIRNSVLMKYKADLHFQSAGSVLFHSSMILHVGAVRFVCREATIEYCINSMCNCNVFVRWHEGLQFSNMHS